VRLDVAAPPGGAAATAVSPAVGATLYRLAQESLANAAKHGAGAARVHVAVDDAGARLVVRNPCDAGAGGAAGSGLAGMRERALALGGAFRAGPADDGAGSWEVDVFLPAEAPS
jgi:signal transduction histidine kinase